MTGGHEVGFAELPDGGRVAYEVHGKTHPGAPILLVRPLGGTMALWGEFGARLAEAHCVIAFDFRGTGRSSPERAWVTTRTMAEDAIAVLDHLGVPRAHVFGISLGGMVATWLPILAPTHVGRLVLASTPARGVSLSEIGLRRDLRLASCFAHGRDDVEVCLARRVLSTTFRATHPDEVIAIEKTVAATPTTRSVLLRHALAGILHDARSELRRIAAPTLVLAGEYDAVVAESSMRALAAALPHATYAAIPRAGHALTLEQPIVAAQRVASFVRG